MKMRESIKKIEKGMIFLFNYYNANYVFAGEI